MSKRVAIPAVCCLALTAGALLLHAQTGISDLWVRFPDGTIQTTAAHNCVNPADPEDEMIRVGGICIDKYEASLWTLPNGGTQISDAQIDGHCPNNGQPFGAADCAGFYARSVAGVQPAASITWFQAQQALANSGKRLPTSAEWQVVASGTPDDSNCNVGPIGSSIANTGAFGSCVSRHGAFDMVGNLWEWVADWGPSTSCSPWPAGYGQDSALFLCGTGSNTSTGAPGALIRGGDWIIGTSAGPFAVIGSFQPSGSDSGIGIRGAR